MKTVFTCISVPVPLARAFLLWNEFEALLAPGAAPRRWALDRGPAGVFRPSCWRGAPPAGDDGTVTLLCLGEGTTRVSLEFRDGTTPAAERSSADLLRFLAMVKARLAAPPLFAPMESASSAPLAALAGAAGK